MGFNDKVYQSHLFFIYIYFKFKVSCSKPCQCSVISRLFISHKNASISNNILVNRDKPTVWPAIRHLPPSPLGLNTGGMGRVWSQVTHLVSTWFIWPPQHHDHFCFHWKKNLSISLVLSFLSSNHTWPLRQYNMVLEGAPRSDLVGSIIVSKLIPGV